MVTTSTNESRTAAASPIKVPAWCLKAAGLVWFTRTAACAHVETLVTTSVIVDGLVEITGAVTLDIMEYSFVAVDQPTIGDQITATGLSGWGDALKIVVTGTATAGGACLLNKSVHPPQPVFPLHFIRGGESFFRTTATKVGAVGRCNPMWTLTFTAPGYNPGSLTRSLNQMRCDNATGANGFRKRRIGCVAFGYAAPVAYSRKKYPELASHVSRAQSSGLPGRVAKAPLTRTTNKKIINSNRSKACGKAPKVKKKSCDEYPLATTNQGLHSGGKLRTFAKCKIKGPTKVKGAKGASACMIAASQNRAQGALMAAFYYDWRVLNGDPFLVQVVK